jgi:F-type H+-transporting ATPase subunit alpha
MAQYQIKPSEISDVLLSQLKSIDLEAKYEEIGTVLQVSDGVARIYGLVNAEAGELLQFDSGVVGVVMNLEEDNVGAVLLGPTDEVKEGMGVKRTGKIASIGVSEALLGRVVDPLGNPLDGLGAIGGELTEMPLERKAPGVIFRQPVNQPLQTGIKSIDAMIPIGRGQRELIIGDRQTGKTAIAIDTIINQRSEFLKGKPVYCIYVAVGQKASTVANIVETLRAKGAMDYTIVVSATAADPAALQYYAPFAGAAVGEYFRDTGRDALVVYDDLSKQAVAYREVSLILRRPSGREAYPGDVFYLHSRLLERAAKIIDQQDVAETMNDLPESMKGKVKAGGSLTALPIIETQAGDVSAYIPTNVISITDGQIYLETSLFNQGFRPAINVGISVSRVGGAAQIKSMKKVAGTLKIDQAQYGELEAFSKFSSDMDKVTAMTIDKGRKNNQLLIQAQYSPMPVGEQIAILYCGTHALMKDIPVGKVREFQDEFLNNMRASHQQDVLDILASGKITDEIQQIIEKEAATVALHFVKEKEEMQAETAEAAK